MKWVIVIQVMGESKAYVFENEDVAKAAQAGFVTRNSGVGASATVILAPLQIP